MRIVVIGGNGSLGSKVVACLRNRGLDVLAASPRGGVNTLTGEGLTEALAGASVVVDVANAPTLERAEVPYSIVRATQFVEFTATIMASLTVGDGVENIGGPARITFEQMVRDVLAKRRLLSSTRRRPTSGRRPRPASSSPATVSRSS